MFDIERGKPILILGLGNPLQGDDGVGCRAIEELQQQPPGRRSLPPGVEAMDGGTPGIGLINLLEGRSRVVVVDAAEMGRPPGTVVRFSADEVTLTGSAERLSLHRTAVADALALTRALSKISGAGKWVLPEIIFYGVQPARIGWGEGLSPEVEAAIPGLVEAILEEL